MSFEKIDHAAEAVVTLIDGMEPEERKALSHDLKVLFPEEFGDHITVTPVVKVEEEVSIYENPSTRDEEIFESLTPEQQEKAIGLKRAMAEKFGMLGAKEKDFLVFPTRRWNEKEERYLPDGTYTVAYAAPQGIDLAYNPNSRDETDVRSWESIFRDSDENDERFIITLGKEEFDTREGMTPITYSDLLSLYQSTAEDEDEPFNFDDDTFTYLTGSPIVETWVREKDWDTAIAGDGRKIAMLGLYMREIFRFGADEDWPMPDYIENQGVPIGWANNVLAHGVLRNYFNRGEEGRADPCSFRPAVYFT